MPVINMKKTGENINRIRKEKGFSMKDLQEIFGFGTLNAVYNWTSGKRIPTIDNLVILAHVFGVTIDDILVTD